MSPICREWLVRPSWACRGMRASCGWALLLAAAISVGEAHERAPRVVITQVERSGVELGDSQRLECQGSTCFGLVSLEVRGSPRTFRAFATFGPGYVRVGFEPTLTVRESPVYLDRSPRDPVVVPVGRTGIATGTFWLAQLARPDPPSNILHPVLRGPPIIGVRIDVLFCPALQPRPPGAAI